MRYLLYNSLLYTSAIVLSPLIAWRLATTKKHRAGFLQKLGFYPSRNSEKTIWIHAVSVGEVMAAEQLIRTLVGKSQSYKVVVTVTTPTGHAIAIQKLSDIAEILYFPYDFTMSVKNAVADINPAVFVTIDTEIWPNVLRECKRHGAKVLLANGRISDRSYPRYKSLSWFFGDVFRNVDSFLMQGETDAKRIIEIGANPTKVEVTGSLKFDSIPAEAETDKETLKSSIGISPNEKIFLLGSVHEGEEDAVCGAIKTAETVGGVRLVIAPRRIENVDWILRVLKENNLSAILKSEMSDSPQLQEQTVLIVDTFGELSKLYSIADVVFIGGSLIKHGGQNPLEPAGYGIAPMFGPHMSNFRDVTETLINCGGAWRVNSEAEIKNLAISLLTDSVKNRKAGSFAKEAVDKNRGATEKTAAKILKILNA